MFSDEGSGGDNANYVIVKATPRDLFSHSQENNVSKITTSIPRTVLDNELITTGDKNYLVLHDDVKRCTHTCNYFSCPNFVNYSLQTTLLSFFSSGCRPMRRDNLLS